MATTTPSTPQNPKKKGRSIATHDVGSRNKARKLNEGPQEKIPVASVAERERWITLLSATRTGPPTELEDPTRSPFERDCDRITFSAPFRRLTDKTQCFPLSGNDSVHTRLPHSLEVAVAGRSLGRLAAMYLVRRQALNAEQVSDVGAIVQAACLAHDIGNPPFGHSGEEALRAWWQECKNSLKHFRFTKEQRKDFANFEGNANGFRLMTETRPLHLTYAVLATYTKYPCEARQVRDTKSVVYKKNGVYHADAANYQRIADACGLKREDKCVRHPLAYLMEAADDICYNVMDLDDARRLGYITEVEVLAAYRSMLEAAQAYLKLDQQDLGNNFSDCRSKVIHYAIRAAAMAWERNYDDGILDGIYPQSLVDTVGMLSTDIVKNLKKRLYSLPVVVKVEAAGYKIIHSLMQVVSDTLLGDWQDRLPVNPFLKRVFLVLPEEERQLAQRIRNDDLPRPNRDQAYKLVLQAAMYVCGMTDSYAVKLHRELNGESISL